MSDVNDVSLPSIKIDVKTGRPYLAKKTLASFKYIYANYYDDYDWFLKADDDTYVIMENLRYFLSTKSKRSMGIISSLQWNKDTSVAVRVMCWVKGPSDVLENTMQRNAIFRTGPQKTSWWAYVWRIWASKLGIPVML